MLSTSNLDFIRNIRTLYTPLQPTTKNINNTISYSEYIPDTELQPFIYCYWELKTNSALTEPFTYRVVTDGCIDIFFELKKPEENYVMGFCKKYTEFSLGKTFHYIGIRFLPTIFPQVFNVDASLLSNKFQLLSQISPDTSEFITGKFKNDLSSIKVAHSFDEYFLNKIQMKNFNNDNRLYRAINTIL